MGIIAIILNAVIIILEITALLKRFRDISLETFAYYTVISNLLTLISCAAAIVCGGAPVLRYLATCMMVMTFAVTVCVLIPVGGRAKELLFTGTGLYHHLICPVLCFISYVFFEPHCRTWMLPVAVTFIYGMIMLWLNHKGKVDGPYPFFKVREQKRSSTVIWMAALICLIAVISLAVRWAAGR